MGHEREAVVTEGIGIREAGRKYGIPSRTIGNWVRYGLIRVLVKPETRGQRALLYEPDLVAILPQHTGQRGRGKRPRLEKVGRTVSLPVD